MAGVESTGPPSWISLYTLSLEAFELLMGLSLTYPVCCGSP